jgi:hypothetical protein
LEYSQEFIVKMQISGDEGGHAREMPGPKWSKVNSSELRTAGALWPALPRPKSFGPSWPGLGSLGRTLLAAHNWCPNTQKFIRKFLTPLGSRPSPSFCSQEKSRNRQD